jgi:hypothetical protein
MNLDGRGWTRIAAIRIVFELHPALALPAGGSPKQASALNHRGAPNTRLSARGGASPIRVHLRSSAFICVSIQHAEHIRLRQTALQT